MDIKSHKIKGVEVAEITSDQFIIDDLPTALDLLGNVYYQGFDVLILKENQLSADFYDLKTKLAGDILQKFSNYKIRLFIIGDFEKYKSNSLQDIIRESNAGKQVNFVIDLEELRLKI